MPRRFPEYRVLTRGALTGYLDEYLVRAGSPREAGARIVGRYPLLTLVRVRRAYMPSLKPSPEIPPCALIYAKSSS